MLERSNGWLNPWAIAMAGLLLLLMGAWTISREIAPNLVPGNTPLERIANSPAGQVDAGLTILSQRSSLSDCELALRSYRSLETRYLSEQQLAGIAPHCKQLAQSTLATTPASSLAWLVLASAAAREQDAKTFAESYTNSVATGPYESWLASMRIHIVSLYPALVTPDLLPLVDQDLASMAASSTFVGEVAQLYLTNTALRDRISGVLETLPEGRQASLLNQIRQALSASGR